MNSKNAEERASQPAARRKALEYQLQCDIFSPSPKGHKGGSK